MLGLLRPRRALFVLLACAVAGLLAAPSQAGVHGGTKSRAAESVVKDELRLEVGRDGTVHAKETITYDFGAGSDDGVRRSFVTRKLADAKRDRVYEVKNFRAATQDGAPVNVSVSKGHDRTKVQAGAGARRTGQQVIVLDYDIVGAISANARREELAWPVSGGWKVEVRETAVTVLASGTVSGVNCTVGNPFTGDPCTQASPGHTFTRATAGQQPLLRGEWMTVMVRYLPGTANADPMYERRHTLATAFTVSKVTSGVLGGLLVLLLGGLVLLYQVRGRDARTVDQRAAEGDHAPVSGDEFDPPDDVRPGQIGTLIDEQADVVDVTATIVDLAVRNHLLIEELPRGEHGRLDWRLRKLPAPEDDLLPYERLLLEALFHDRDSVKLSELGGTFAEELAVVRGELYDDVVTQGWFARRPDTVRTRWTTAGIVLTGLGVVGTIALAMLTDLALIGLAGIIAGAALAIGGQYMPAKTAQGATVLAHTLGLRAYLARGEASEEAPQGHRIELFSRYLPYAIVFDSVERWAETVADIGQGDQEEADHLDWYEGPAEWDLSDFAESIRSFTLATSGAISATRQFRSM